MSEVLVRAEKVSKIYRVGEGEVVALSAVNFQVRTGERVAVLGPSGSGKTTLLHLIAGLETPSDGVIEWPALGSRRELLPSRVSLAFQGPSLIPALSLVENVALPLLLIGAREAQAEAAAMSALEEFELGDLAAKLPEELSGGQIQRGAVARALIGTPRLILADEPTGQQDRATAGRLMSQLLGRASRLGAAIVVATHDPSVAQLFDRQWSPNEAARSLEGSLRSH